MRRDSRNVLGAAVGLVLALALTACKARIEERPDAASPSAAGPSRLLLAELSRDSSGITAAELSSRELATRRAAIRALARASSEASRDLLRRAVADEDPEVVAWATFGLGRLCTAGAAESTLRTLIGRAATLLFHAEPSRVDASGAALDPWYALAEAIGRCALPESERVLRSWLRAGPEHARMAALGLDTYVRAKRTLDDASVVALLDVAEKERGLAAAFLPISHLTRIDALVGRRMLALAPQILDTAGEEKRFLLRALALVGASAIPVLERVALDDSRYQPLERVEAIRALSKLEGDGQRVLSRLVPRIIADDTLTSEAVLLSPRWQLMSELMTQLEHPASSSFGTLSRVAKLEASNQLTAPLRRRISWLRCRAAALASSNDPASAWLQHCDLGEEQRHRKLAELSMLARRQSERKKAGRLEALAIDSDPIVRMAALERLVLVEDAAKRFDLLRQGLAAESMGVVSKSAQWLAQRPTQVVSRERSVGELAAALESALRRPWPPDAIEVKVSLIDAAAALGLLTVKSEVQKACSDGAPLVRQHAERALQVLGEPKQRCEAPPTRALPAEANHLEHRIRTLHLQTDVGVLELQLEPKLAPVAVTRIADLARSGFYDGVVVHRVVPGFVVQLGDRGADGFGGTGTPPIPCELSPQPFAARDVGIALSGPDSGSSQFFVTLGPYPQLGGEYTRIGRAGPGWEKLGQGDVIQKVVLVP